MIDPLIGWLQAILQRHLPSGPIDQLERDLLQWGAQIATDYTDYPDHPVFKEELARRFGVKETPK